MTLLEERIGYEFKQPELLEHALTHSSYANERGMGRAGCNERLEFLGDSVLGFVIAETLFLNFPDMPEGSMTRLRADLVCEESLVAAAEPLELGSFLKLGRGELQTGGRTRPSILADAFEAVLAAVYLDGGEEAARGMISRTILPMLPAAAELHRDYKTLLQEFLQARGKTPVYRQSGESGPDHCKRFSCEVSDGASLLGNGEGRSKKDAEQAAAKAACALLQVPLR